MTGYAPSKQEQPTTTTENKTMMITRYYASTHRDGRHLLFRVVTDYSTRATFRGVGIEVERRPIARFDSMKHARHAAARLNGQSKAPWMHMPKRAFEWLQNQPATVH